MLCLLYSLFFFGLGLSAPVPNIPPSEMKALYDIYNATHGDSWSWRPVYQTLGIPWNFSSNANPCHENWQGLRCKYLAPYYHINEMTLVAYNITGTLPDSIRQLTNIKVIELSVNMLTGTIPVTIGELSNLQLLDLSSNALTGPIPYVLSQLVELRKLGMQANRLTGSIPEFFTQLPKLSYLSMSLNKLHGSLPRTLSNLSELTFVYFFGNRLTGAIPSAYGNLSNMLDLYLQGNLLSGGIPATLGNLTRLRNLDLSNNALTGRIPPSLGQLSEVINFYLHTNELAGHIPNTIGGMTKLQFLDVSSNHLTGPIPPVLANLTHLQYIQLYINELTGRIPEELYALSGLQRLDLNTNRFVSTVPENLNFWPQMLLFDISSNYFIGTLPASVVNLTLLQYLALNDNFLSGAVPVSLATLAELSVLHLQDNQFTGPLTTVFNASLQTALAAVEVSNNQFSGALPAQLFSMNALSSLVAVGNCFYGTIPAAVCNATKMVSLVLDGLSSAHSCRTTLLPGISSSYVIKRSVTGTIPACLFELPVLTTLHLSGNGFTGSLPKDVLGPSLVDMIISHNRLTGSIPAQVQERRWYNLDLSFNRLSGTLVVDIETRSANITPAVQAYIKPVYGIPHANASDSASIIPSLSLQNNRISGLVPASLRSFANISILGSNMFYCDLLGTNLPRHDSGRSNYECGSARFDVTYYIWMALVCTVLAIVVTAALFLEKKRAITSIISSYLQVLEQYSNLGSNFKARLTTFRHLLDIICRMAVLCAAFTVVALLPVYVACAYYFGTYTHSYAWAASAAYQSGVVPVGLEILLLLALLCSVIIIFTRSIASLLGTRTVQQHRVGSTRNAHLQQHIVSVTLLQKSIIYFVYTLVNLVMVMGVNVAYVYIAIYRGSALLVFAQIALSVFKLAWNSFCAVKLMRVIVQRTLSDESTEADKFSETQFVSLQIFIALLNSIVIPCLVVVMISPNCFYNVFVAPPTVNAYYTYEYCTVFSEAGDCTFYNTKLGTTAYSPPFTYSYQCSSSLITYYAPAFVNLCIISTFATPAVQYVLSNQMLLRRAKAGTMWYFLLDYYTPRLQKELSVETDKSGTFLRANEMLTILITYLGTLLTFGAVFPPLAVALAITICVFVLVAKLKIAKFLRDAVEKGFPELVDKVDLECHGVGAVSVLKNAMWMLITVSCCFYTLFLFDTLGNEVGFRDSFWLLLVVPAMPAVMYGGHKLIMRRCMPLVGVAEDEATVESGGAADGNKKIITTDVNLKTEKETVSVELAEVPASRSRHNTAVGLQITDSASPVVEIPESGDSSYKEDRREDGAGFTSTTYNTMLKQV